MQQLGERVRAAARITGSVLVTGETGSGKELVARSIHEHSGRSTGRFVAVDCGALPEDLIESELFGFKRGAFTSALTDKAGLFEEANGGTLFLDEIANTSRRFQAKLLRALQERQIRRLGDTAVRQLDIRVVAATNLDLRALVSRGDFREDLFYRLSVFAIQVPPLRNRLDDIPLLVDAMLNGRKQITSGALEKLQLYDFPGNVRELENIIESAVYTATGESVEECHIVLPGGMPAGVTDILHVETSGTRWRVPMQTALLRAPTWRMSCGADSSSRMAAIADWCDSSTCRIPTTRGSWISCVVIGAISTTVNTGRSRSRECHCRGGL